MLEIKNIYKTFNPGTINEKVALNGLSLKLNEGDFVTVIGGNGAGNAGVDVGRDEAASLTDLGANKHFVALFDQGFRRSADVLAHQDAYLRGQRHRDRFACSSCLVMRRMRAKRRTFQLVQHGINPPFCLNCHPHAHAGALVQGQQLLNTLIVSFWRGKSTTSRLK